MQVNTKYFGSVDYEEEQILHFPRGLFGFEEEKAFLLLPFSGSEGTLLCFQSVRTPGLAFVAMNPFALKADYTPVLTAAELKEMGVSRSEDLCYYVLCAVKMPIEQSAVNLRCPVVVNEDTGTAIQVILETVEYSMHQALLEFKGEEEAASC
jgi:flagellar assembly factor FliW